MIITRYFQMTHQYQKNSVFQNATKSLNIRQNSYLTDEIENHVIKTISKYQTIQVSY